MRNAILAIVAACALGAPAAQAQTLMRDWSIEEMSTLLAEEGVAVLRSGPNETGAPVIEARAASGLTIVIYGTECNGVGERLRCTGAEITAEFRLDGEGAVTAAWRTLDFAAVSFVALSDNRLRMARYVIFDNGIERENLRVNLVVFLAIGDLVQQRLGSI